MSPDGCRPAGVTSSEPLCPEAIGQCRKWLPSARQEEAIMGEIFSGSMTTLALVAAATVCQSVAPTAAHAQAPSATALTTPWGEPDLQGIWTDEFDTPFQRPAKYANQEFFTDAQREELDKERLALLNRRATERELSGAYNLAVFTSVKHVGMRTSLIVDPPNGQ